MALSHELLDQERYRRALRPGLRLDPMIEQGKDISEEETDAEIRAILTDDGSPAGAAHGTERAKPILRQRALPKLASQGEMRRRAPRRALVREVETAVQNQVREARAEEMRTPQVQDRGKPVASDESASRTGKREWIKPALLAGLVGAVILRPGAVLLAAFAAFWMVVIGLITIGRGSVADGFGVIYRRMKARNPVRVERFRVRMDIWAERWDRVLDMVPGDWADGLAMPDFSRGALDPDAAAAQRPDPFERLAKDDHADHMR